MDMEQQEAARDVKQPRFSLSQETIAVLTIGIAVVGINLAHMGEIRADRARLEASMHQMRAEGRADREAFEKKITRIVEQQGTLNGLVEGLRNPLPSSQE